MRCCLALLTTLLVLATASIGEQADTAFAAADDAPLAEEATEESAVGDRLLIIHDSVILGARTRIEATFPETDVNYIGFGGLRVGPAAELLAARTDLLADQVVVEIGTNYLGSQKLFRTELDRLMGLMVDVEHVIWLTAGRYSPRMDAVNEEIRAAARRYPNLQIAEWGPLSDINGEYTWGDGIHLQPGGADAITELIRAHLEGEVPWNRIPVGRIGLLRDGRKAVTVRGWATNPDLGRAAMVRLTVDGELVAKKLTHRKRAKLAQDLNVDVVDLGFEFKLNLPDGTHDVCIEANNFDGLPPLVMHCRTIELQHSPLGALEQVVAKSDGDVVRGWATDPDRNKPVVIQIRQSDASGDATGEIVASGRASRTRKADPDGPATRFALKVPQGTNGYCVVARNLLAGTDTTLGCRD